jgi:hypothetical protein
MPADREAVFRPSAARAFEEADADDQEELDRIIRNICIDPAIQAPFKVPLMMPPAVLTLYNDGAYWILYHLPNNTTVDVWMVGKAPEPPPRGAWQ